MMGVHKEKKPVNKKTHPLMSAPAESLTPENIEAVHEALRALDGSDYQAGVGRGFCMVDWKFGRSLARSAQLTAQQAHAGRWLVYKHRRQLPERLLVRAGIDTAQKEKQHQNLSTGASGLQ